MFITCIHVAVIVLALLPSVLTVWQKDKTRHIWLDITVTLSAAAAAFLLVVPIGVEDFGFNHSIEFFVWLAAVAVGTVAVLVLFAVNFRKNKRCVLLAAHLVVSAILVLTAVFEGYTALLTAAVVFLALGLVRHSLARRDRAN